MSVSRCKSWNSSIGHWWKSRNFHSLQKTANHGKRITNFINQSRKNISKSGNRLLIKIANIVNRFLRCRKTQNRQSRQKIMIFINQSGQKKIANFVSQSQQKIANFVNQSWQKNPDFRQSVAGKNNPDRQSIANSVNQSRQKSFGIYIAYESQTGKKLKRVFIILECLLSLFFMSWFEQFLFHF